MRGRNSSLMTLTIIISVFTVLIAIGGTALNALVRNTQTCTIESKDRATGQNGESSMRVYTKECGVLTVSDTIIGLSFDSADRYAQLKPGKRYELETMGIRIPVFSTFPNIIEIKEK